MSMEKGPTQQEIVDQLFYCAAKAAKANENERAELIESALTWACNFLTRLNFRIEYYIDEALRQSGLNPEGTPVSMLDLARSHAELDIFRNREELGEFLDVLGLNMVNAGNIDEDRMGELKSITLNSYDKMLEQSLDKSELFKNFLILKGVCCSPPDDPGSGEPTEPDPDSPKPGGFWKTADKALDILARLAGIGALFLALHGSPQKSSPVAPPVPSQPNAPLIVKMLLLLLISVVANEASALGALPLGIQKIIDGGGNAKEITESLKRFLQETGVKRIPACV